MGNVFVTTYVMRKDGNGTIVTIDLEFSSFLFFRFDSKRFFPSAVRQSRIACKQRCLPLLPPADTKLNRLSEQTEHFQSYIICTRCKDKSYSA